MSSSLRGSISCVASVHKLLLVYTSTFHIQNPSSTTSIYLSIKQATAAHRQLQALLRELQSKFAGASTWHGSTNTSSVDSGAPITPAGSDQQAVSQLQAMVVMVLTWLGNHLRKVMSVVDGGVGWSVRELLGWMFKLEKQHDFELAHVARQLSLPIRPEHWQSSALEYYLEGTEWGKYAVQRFHGRLLPSCSYLRCTNMNGTSEASLVTLLCSGCRRTRYCSVDCQRAAWKEGGHSDVCGRGDWLSSRE